MLIDLQSKSPLFRASMRKLRGRNHDFLNLRALSNPEQHEAIEAELPEDVKAEIEELKKRLPIEALEEGESFRIVPLRLPDVVLFAWDGRSVVETTGCLDTSALYVVFREVVGVVPSLSPDMSDVLEETHWIVTHYLKGHKVTYFVQHTPDTILVDKVGPPVPMFGRNDPMSIYYTSTLN